MSARRRSRLFFWRARGKADRREKVRWTSRRVGARSLAGTTRARWTGRSWALNVAGLTMFCMTTFAARSLSTSGDAIGDTGLGYLWKARDESRDESRIAPRRVRSGGGKSARRGAETEEGRGAVRRGAEILLARRARIPIGEKRKMATQRS